MSTVEFKFISRLEDPQPVDLDITDGDRVDTALEKLQGQINFVREDAYAQNRFPNREDSIIAFNASTRTFSIRPSASTYRVFFMNPDFRSVLKTSIESIQITDVTGLHYIYFDRLTLQLASTTSYSDDLILQQTLVASVYWNSTLSKHIYFSDQRHGTTMSPATHLYFQQSFGAQYISGLEPINVLVDQDASVDAHAKFGITNGIVRDEDIKIEIIDGSPGTLQPFAELTTLYRTGSGVWNRSDISEYPLLRFSTTGLPYFNFFNGTDWIVQEASNNSYVLMHLVATNDVQYPMAMLVGGNYVTRSMANTNALAEFKKLSGLPFEDCSLIATFIFSVNNSYTNTPKATLVATEDGMKFIDWRKNTVFNLQQPAPANNIQIRVDGGAANTTFNNYVLRFDFGTNGATINPAGTQ